MRNLLPMRLCVVLGLMAGCSVVPGTGAEPNPELTPFLGVYRGSFESALTEDPGDDLNHNPCTPGGDDDCLTHRQPLADVLLELQHSPQGVRLAFYANEADRAAGRELDLLGRGCGTRLGVMESVQPAAGASPSAAVGTGAGSVSRAATAAADPHLHHVAVFPLTADNRLCLGKLRPVSRHHVRLELHPQHDEAHRFVRVVIDRNVRDDNYLYVMEDGVQRRVKIDLDNTLHADHMDRYRVCIEDDLGEYDRCVLTDRRFRSFVLPVPVPGGVAVGSAWWQELRPRLRRTEGRWIAERYVGRFEPITPAGS